MAEQEETPYQEYQPQWGRATRLIVAILLILAAIFALTLLGPVIQMLIVAFLIAFLVLAPSRFLTEHTPLPYTAWVFICYAFLVVTVLLALLILIPPFVDAANGLLGDVRDGVTTLEGQLQEYTPGQGVVTVLGVPVDLDFILTPLKDFVVNSAQVAGGTTSGTQGSSGTTTSPPPPAFLQNLDLRSLFSGAFNVAGTVTSTVTSTITTVTGFLAALLLALFISFLVLIDLPNTQAGLIQSIPRPYWREYALLFERIERVWNGFFRGQVAIALIIGVLTWVQLRLMGAPGAEILAVFTGFISLIPTLGGFIALIPLSIVPLLQGSLVFTQMSNVVFALLVVGVNLVITQVIWNVVAPMILGDILDLPIPVVIVGVFIGAAAGGILGAFLVAPIMSSLRVIVAYLFNKIYAQDPYPGQQPRVALGEGFFGHAYRRSQAARRRRK